MEILELTINATGFTDVTGQISPRLSKWAADGQITGDALCVVTMVSGGAGLIVTEFDPAAVQFSSAHDVGGHAPFGFNIAGFQWAHQVAPHPSLVVDHSDIRRLFARTSEIFAVRGPTIAGGRRIHVLRYGSDVRVRCEVALALL